GGAFVLLVLAWEGTRGRFSFLALPASLIALGSLALTGHAMTAGPLWLTLPVLAVHVLVAAFWLGSLWPLWQAVGRRTPEAAYVLLRRFSAIAPPAVLVPVLGVATVAILQLGRIGELLTTPYGLRLSCKICFVLLLLLLAALNRFWLTPALTFGRAAATHRLRASIGLEIGIGVAILAATSSLGEVPPPRVLIAEAKAHAAMSGVSVVTCAGERGALIEMAPAERGTNAITLHLFDADGKPVAAQQVTIELALPAAGVEPIEHEATPGAPGVFTWSNAVLPIAGDWQIRLRVLISD